MIFDKTLGEKLVLMKTTGPQGRFNRAQRSHMNLLETLPVYITGAMLSGYVVGPVAFGVSIVWFIGKNWMTFGYANSNGGRLPGFALSVFMEMITSGLVLSIGVCALANWTRLG